MVNLPRSDQLTKITPKIASMGEFKEENQDLKGSRAQSHICEKNLDDPQDLLENILENDATKVELIGRFDSSGGK